VAVFGFGWPDKTPELKKYYPNTTMVTGHDILFFWVARMILMGEYVFDKDPFPEVYLHSLIFGKSYWREKKDGGIEYVDNKERIEYDLGKPIPKGVHFKWEKMSKSKGNIIDPIEIIDQYGTDAIRMALCASASQAWQIDLDRRRFEEFKNFTNKIWNGARFVFMNLEGLTAEELAQGLDEAQFNLEDRWILSVLNRITQDVNKNLETYQFDQAAQEAYDFFWDEFCSYYLEIAKPALFGKTGTPEEKKNKQKLLVILLCNAIRLIHPMAPFITEELFQILKERFAGIKHAGKTDPYTEETIQALQSPACIIAPYPKMIRKSDMKNDVNACFKLIGEVVYTIRNIRGEMKIPPGTGVDVHIVGTEKDAAFEQVGSNVNIVTALVKTNSINLHEEPPAHVGFASIAMVETLKVMIVMPEDLKHAEKSRLEKEREKTVATIEKMRQQLENKDFVERAPAALIDKQRESLRQTENKLKEIDGKLNSF
jgi:valyl-tRNA synthetase